MEPLTHAVLLVIAIIAVDLVLLLAFKHIVCSYAAKKEHPGSTDMPARAALHHQ